MDAPLLYYHYSYCSRITDSEERDPNLLNAVLRYQYEFTFNARFRLLSISRMKAFMGSRNKGLEQKGIIVAC